MKNLKVIFLDVDGVLNNDSTGVEWYPYVRISTALVAKLSKIVEKTDAEIYLVSDWKREWYKDNKAIQDIYADFLDFKLAQFGLKITDKVEGGSCTRGKNINEFLGNHDVSAYVILDDDDYDYYDCGHGANYVPIYAAVGLSDENVRTAIDILNDENKTI